MIIRGHDGGDELVFEHDGIFFSSGATKNLKDARCVASAWGDELKLGVGSRVGPQRTARMWMVLTKI